MATKVPKIADVNVDIVRGETKQLFVVAAARVPAYTNVVAQLIPYSYSAPPTDGIYDYDFTANLPDVSIPNGSSDMLISAAALLALPDSSPVKGVRVHGSANQVVTRVPTITDSGTPASDDFRINQATTKHDKLIVSVQYTGGCERHDFELRWDGSYLESLPPQVHMRLTHKSNGDPCDALPSEELQFDLLDLDPCIIRLSSEFGYASSIPFKLTAPHPPVLIPFGPGGIPIIDEAFLRLIITLLQDNAALDQFRTDPISVMASAGITEEQLTLGNGAVGVLNGTGGICNQPTNGFGGILSRLGVRQEVIDALCQTKP